MRKGSISVRTEEKLSLVTVLMDFLTSATRPLAAVLENREVEMGVGCWGTKALEVPVTAAMINVAVVFISNAGWSEV